MTFDFAIYDIEDNGEFLTFAKVDLLIDGCTVETHEFVGSSEEPGPDARTQALSFASSWVESHETPLEERLAPFGDEWLREQEEGRW